MPAKSLIAPGDRYGKLVVRQEAKKRSHRMFLCDCDCGGQSIVALVHLSTGHTKSCGCVKEARALMGNPVHGYATGGELPPEYRAWLAMKNRCYNPNEAHFHNYGGRGIKVHEEWRKSFVKFLEHVGPRPSPEYSLDRYPNNNGNYEPGNVRWATRVQQTNNQRKNVILTLNGEKMSMSQWAHKLDMSVCTLYGRLKHGWSIRTALTKPVRKMRKMNTAISRPGPNIED